MPVHVSWYDEDHEILYYKFDKMWKLEEMFVALSTGQSMVAAEDHIVDSIADLSGTSTIPQHMLASMRSVERTTPKNLRYTVAIGMNPLLAALAKLLGKTAPLLMKHFKTTRTLEEALVFIQDIRATTSGISSVPE